MMKPLITTTLPTPLLMNPGDRVILMRYEQYRANEEAHELAVALAVRAKELLEFNNSNADRPYRVRLKLAVEVFVNTVRQLETL